MLRFFKAGCSRLAMRDTVIINKLFANTEYAFGWIPHMPANDIHLQGVQLGGSIIRCLINMVN